MSWVPLIAAVPPLVGTLLYAVSGPPSSVEASEMLEDDRRRRQEARDERAARAALRPRTGIEVTGAPRS